MFRLPLFDHRILDLTTSAAGAYATRLMGDLGGEVIMFEPPERAEIPDLYVNKYSTSLDRDAVLKLAAHADVAVADSRDAPSFADFAAVNTGLILITLPDRGSAATAVAAVAALGVALWDRRRTGCGSHIVVPPLPAPTGPTAAPEAGAFEPVASSGGLRNVRSPHLHLSETPLHVRLPAPSPGEHDAYVARLLS